MPPAYGSATLENLLVTEAMATLDHMCLRDDPCAYFALQPL